MLIGRRELVERGKKIQGKEEDGWSAVPKRGR